MCYKRHFSFRTKKKGGILLKVIKCFSIKDWLRITLCQLCKLVRVAVLDVLITDDTFQSHNPIGYFKVSNSKSVFLDLLFSVWTHEFHDDTKGHTNDHSIIYTEVVSLDKSKISSALMSPTTAYLNCKWNKEVTLPVFSTEL